MLRIENIAFGIAGRPLIKNASATIPEGHKVALWGAMAPAKPRFFA